MSEHSWNPGDPVVIDLIRRPPAEVAWLLVLGGGFLLWATFSAVPVDGPNAGQVAVFAVSALCLGLGLVLLARRVFRLEVRGLFLEAGGLALEQSSGRSWSVPWEELAYVSISTDRTHGREWLAIELVPAGSGFEARHPELARFRIRDAVSSEERYTVPIAPGQKHFAALERGLVLYAQARYRDGG